MSGRRSTVEREIRRAMQLTREEIAGIAGRGGLYARGLASEGYAGGYAQALADVLLVMAGCRPNGEAWREYGAPKARGRKS